MGGSTSLMERLTVSDVNIIIKMPDSLLSHIIYPFPLVLRLSVQTCITTFPNEKNRALPQPCQAPQKRTAKSFNTLILVQICFRRTSQRVILILSKNWTYYRHLTQLNFDWQMESLLSSITITQSSFANF